MKYTAFAQLFREKAVGNNDSTAVPDATITLYANIAKDNIAKEIVTKINNGSDHFDIDLTTDLVVDQREYPFPFDVLKNIRVVQAYLGDAWRRVYPFDVNQYHLAGNDEKPYYGHKPTQAFSGATTDEATIVAQFSDAFPKFDVDGESIVIFSDAIAAVTSGLKLKANIYPADYVDADWASGNDMSIRTSTTSTSMPRQSHDTLLMNAVIQYKESRGISLTVFEQDYKDALQAMLDTLSDINTDDAMQSETPEDDGSNY